MFDDVCWLLCLKPNCGHLWWLNCQHHPNMALSPGYFKDSRKRSPTFWQSLSWISNGSCFASWASHLASTLDRTTSPTNKRSSRQKCSLLRSNCCSSLYAVMDVGPVKSFQAASETWTTLQNLKVYAEQLWNHVQSQDFPMWATTFIWYMWEGQKIRGIPNR